MASKGSKPAPFIYWGQSKSKVFLKVALRDVKNSQDVSVEGDKVMFAAHGVGAHGTCDYAFNLSTYASILPEKSVLRVIDSAVLIELVKASVHDKEDSSWPRLTKDSVKYPWIRPDFDKMDISDDEDENAALNKKLQEDYIKKVTADIQKTYTDAVNDIKRNYLFMYSLFQLIAYSFITLRTVIGLLFKEDYNAYGDVGIVMIICQFVSFMEVVHPLIGVVKSGFVAPLIQTCARNFVLMVLVWNVRELQISWATSFLFFFWSAAEMIRYPFYMATVMKIELKFLTWLRYTAWIPLYPLGAGCEWIIVLKSFPLFQSSNRFSLELPNRFNFAFYFPYFLACYLVILPLGLFHMMSYMAIQRRKKLHPGKSPLPRSKKTN